MPNRDGRRRFVCAASALTLSLSPAYAALAVTRAELKAAFVYNFATFTEWPADALAAGAPLVLCVIGDSAVAQALDRSAGGRQIEGHRVVVRKMDANGPVRSCHVLYAGGIAPKGAHELLEAVKGIAVLTVSDLATFTQQGGTAHLFVEGERMRFAVNVESAQRFGLRLSSRLLSLAKLVKDDPDAAPH